MQKQEKEAVAAAIQQPMLTQEEIAELRRASDETIKECREMIQRKRGRERP